MRAWTGRHEVIGYDSLEGIYQAELALTGDAEQAHEAKMEAMTELKIQEIMARK